MLSQTAEYALRATLFLAAHPQEAFTTQQISQVTKAPTAYLSKVLKHLVQANLIHSQRGIGGGFVLQKPAAQMSILEIINAVDPVQRVRTCPLGLSSHGTALCALHRRLDEAMELIERSFAETTLAELLANPTTSTPLCSTVEQYQKAAPS